MSNTHPPLFVAPTNDAECSAIYNKALVFAMEAHGSQTYDKGVPYIVHPIGVCTTLSRFGFYLTDLDFGFYVMCVAVLHDIIEDTKYKYRDIKANFGLDVAEAVFCLTDELGRDRDEVNRKTWPKIRNNPYALPVKLADRIFNTETSLANKSHQLTRYRNEFTDFMDALSNGKHMPMWKHLEAITEKGNQEHVITTN
jgi:(p)ppGpp synthase/HD superfamily hydrolase